MQGREFNGHFNIIFVKKIHDMIWEALNKVAWNDTRVSKCVDDEVVITKTVGHRWMEKWGLYPESTQTASIKPTRVRWKLFVTYYLFNPLI